MPENLPRFLTALACMGAALAVQAAGALPGTLWHSFSDLDNAPGTFVSDPNSGVSAMADKGKWRVPWPDGSRFIQRDYDTDRDQTRLTVRSTGDRRVLMDQVVDGFVGDAIRPSPSGANQILALWGQTILAPRAAVVYDLDARRLLYATAPSKTPDALSWMPDGSLLRVQPSGRISRVVPGGAEQAVATLRWPESRVPQALYVSPDGRKALVQLAALRDTGSVAGVDLWMMDIDGGNLRRFTRNDIIAAAFWSPDSRHVAFAKDTGVSCTAATCQGSCTVWHAEATASNVVAVKASGDAGRFPLRRPNGSTTSVGCPAMAWTR
jgi:hypothetical protein